MGRAFDACTKYVASRTRRNYDWVNTTWLGDDPVAMLRSIKQGEGPVLLVQGSSDFVQTLLAADLVDRLQVMIFPVLLGSGKRLFGEGTRPCALKLVKSTTSPSGVVIATYERDGAVRTGSFALE
jgi:dihydrofolate reductase